MFADKHIKKQTRIFYARVIIDMDVTQELPSENDIIEPSSKLFSPKVGYDWNRVFCRKDVKYGHVCRGDTERDNGHPPKTDQVTKKQAVQAKGAQRGKKVIRQWKKQVPCSSWSSRNSKASID